MQCPQVLSCQESTKFMFVLLGHVNVLFPLPRYVPLQVVHHLPMNFLGRSVPRIAGTELTLAYVCDVHGLFRDLSLLCLGCHFCWLFDWLGCCLWFLDWWGCCLPGMWSLLGW